MATIASVPISRAAATPVAKESLSDAKEQGAE